MLMGYTLQGIYIYSPIRTIRHSDMLTIGYSDIKTFGKLDIKILEIKTIEHLDNWTFVQSKIQTIGQLYCSSNNLNPHTNQCPITAATPTVLPKTSSDADAVWCDCTLCVCVCNSAHNVFLHTT